MPNTRAMYTHTAATTVAARNLRSVANEMAKISTGSVSASDLFKLAEDIEKYADALKAAARDELLAESYSLTGL